MALQRASPRLSNVSEKAIRVEQYRVRAEELRVIGESMKKQETKSTMLRIAQDYENMADRIEHMDLADVPFPLARKPKP